MDFISLTKYGVERVSSMEEEERESMESDLIEVPEGEEGEDGRELVEGIEEIGDGGETASRRSGASVLKLATTRPAELGFQRCTFCLARGKDNDAEDLCLNDAHAE